MIDEFVVRPDAAFGSGDRGERQMEMVCCDLLTDAQGEAFGSETIGGFRKVGIVESAVNFAGYVAFEATEDVPWRLPLTFSTGRVLLCSWIGL